MSNDSIENSIAVIGISGRFPGASSASELWEILKNGQETIRRFTREEILAEDFDSEYILSQDNFVAARGVMENPELFDADFFKFTPREAAFTDPQQRIWLELAWEALESAGYAHPNHDRAIGVYTGYLNSNYLLYNLLKNRTDVENYVRTRYSDDFSFMLANTNSYIATRTAYKLNLKGPAINVQTACSTSLVSVIMASQSLLQFESDICIAGGINIATPQTTGYFYQEGAILSRDGHCRPFDADAAGTVFGSGGGAVVLKRLEEAIEDQDHIISVIRGAAINNDGANKVGFTAPSVDGQAECITLAQSIADVDPSTIQYIEAHGTATPMGDPIEIAGLTKAFGDCDGKRQFCGIGSIKSNIGHLDSAAGVTGLIKTMLALQHKQIPPSLHYKKPNPNIDFSQTPFYVVDKLVDWETFGEPRRAGVSSFGVGGTNAHVVLEEAPSLGASRPSNEHQLLLLSAKNSRSLEMAVENLAEYFKKLPDSDVADAAWTLLHKRQHFSERRFVVTDNETMSAAESLSTLPAGLSGVGQADEGERRIAFAFPGQGSHYYGMGERLAERVPVFQKTLRQCCDLANRFIDEDLSELFTTKISEDTYASRMSHNGVAQLAIFSIDYSMAKLWQSFGIEPSVLLGHSLGEWVAACVGGVLSLEQAIEAVWHRGRLMHSVSGDGGALTVFATKEKVEPYLESDNFFAAENAPGLTLISGPQSAMVELQKRLKKGGIKSKMLDITVAVHSPALDSIIMPFGKILSKFEFSKSTIPIISTATGAELSDEQALDPAYWSVQMRKPVQFCSAMKSLWSHDSSVLMLESGPGRALSSLSRLQGEVAQDHPAIPSLGQNSEVDEHKQVLGAFGQLWTWGIDIDATVLFGEEPRRTVPLPTYAFDKQRYWIDPPSVTASGGPSNLGDSIDNVFPAMSRGRDKKAALSRIWADILGLSNVEENADFRNLGGDSLAAVRLMERIRRDLGVSLPLSALETAPTILQMVRLLQDDADEEEMTTCLVPVKTAKNSKRPILFVPHGGGGDVHWGYVNITAGFDDDQPVWGIENTKDRSFDSFAEMASHYAEVIKSKQPKGPYYLAGYCFAGILAQEIACQLRDRGDEVAFLALMESTPSNTGYEDISFSFQFLQGVIANIPYHVQDWLALSTHERKEHLLKRFFKAKEFGLSKLRSFFKEEMVELRKRVAVEDLIGNVEQISPDMMAVWEHNLELLGKHTSRVCDIPIEVFRTQQQGLISQHDPALGWRSLTTSEVTCHAVPGNHVTVVNPPYAEALGRMVCDRLTLAQKR